MLPLVLAATATPTAVAVGAPPPTQEMEAAPTHRAGVAVGASIGAGLAGASGYPNNAVRIGDPSFYSSSGLMVGAIPTVFAMGAIADYLNFGLWFSHATYSNGDWRSNGDAGGLRVEAFPLVRFYPRLEGLGLLAQFGIGGATLDSKKAAAPEAEGTQSFAAAGVFYEWPFGALLGGHFAAGPSVEYDAMWSLPFERHGMQAGVRFLFYGGP